MAKPWPEVMIALQVKKISFKFVFQDPVMLRYSFLTFLLLGLRSTSLQINLCLINSRLINKGIKCPFNNQIISLSLFLYKVILYSNLICKNFFLYVANFRYRPIGSIVQMFGKAFSSCLPWFYTLLFFHPTSLATTSSIPHRLSSSIWPPNEGKYLGGVKSSFYSLSLHR